jgi:hypothetical protein
MRQGELFPTPIPAEPAAAELPLRREQLLDWQQRLAELQAPLFERSGSGFGSADPSQVELFGGDPAASRVERLNPLDLRPQPLSFWRWPQSCQQGAALYFVIDQPPHLANPLLLYVGETARADRRWKGDHDCKSYLAAYGEALLKEGLEVRLTIRFWLDVPTAVRPRRALEQALIRRWQPPFNKETRGRWATPFQAEPS